MNTLMLSAAVMFTGLFPMSGLFGHMWNNDFNMMGNNNSNSMMGRFTSNSRNNNSNRMMDGYSNRMMDGYSYDDMMDDENESDCH